MRKPLYIILYIGMAAMTACTEHTLKPNDEGHMQMRFSMQHPTQTRATATAFEPGDKVGLYVTADTAALNPGGNTVSNEPLTCTGTGQAWTSRQPLYWDKGRYNIYAYYPYQSAIETVSDLPFNVCLDQSNARQGTQLGGYEASDLLWATAPGTWASENTVPLSFKHIMSRLSIRLVKGEDFKGEMPTEADVYVHNTIPECTVDLASGIATRYMYGKEATIKAHQRSNYIYEAIVVPQRITRRRPLVEVVMKGVSYMYESNFVFKPGTDHLINVIINDNPEKLTIDITGEVQQW